jgi:hypothetical protein
MDRAAILIDADRSRRHLQYQVVAKDFGSGESAKMTVTFLINPLVTGTKPVVVATANPLVALFGAPPCPGSKMRVKFTKQAVQAL